jgi:tRNA uridine 5-carboxymethylaminomethyl modification enzyme
MLKRPGTTWKDIAKLASWISQVDSKVLDQTEAEIKYEGYISRELKRADDLSRKEEKTIPMWVDYGSIPGLSREATEKLGRVRPRSLGQAARIPGITPADLSSLLIHIEKKARTA